MKQKIYLPSSYNLIRGGYVGGPTTCHQQKMQTKSCQTILMRKGIILFYKVFCSI